jgi:hypothetical protein
MTHYHTKLQRSTLSGTAEVRTAAMLLLTVKMRSNISWRYIYISFIRIHLLLQNSLGRQQNPMTSYYKPVFLFHIRNKGSLTARKRNFKDIREETMFLHYIILSPAHTRIVTCSTCSCLQNRIVASEVVSIPIRIAVVFRWRALRIPQQ